MRNKVAKKLRNQAKQEWMIPNNYPWVNYETYQTGQVTLSDRCGRAIYQELKKEHKKENQ